MRAQEQMPYEEIAAALGISVGAAKVKVHRARRKVAAIAHESGGTVVMNVTREIVKDLLPLYVAGEASEESRAAVEEWLRTDPELARLAAELRDDAAPPPATAVPQPSGQAALTATKALLRRRSWLLALALLFTGLPASFAFDSGGLTILHASRRSAHRRQSAWRRRSACGSPLARDAPPACHRTLMQAAAPVDPV